MSLPWHDLRNPVFSHPDYSCKDACVIFADGRYHLFTSTFDEDRSTVAYLTTPDFRSFSPILRRWTGDEIGAVGLCSPSICAHEGHYVLQFNSWGEPKPRLNKLFVVTTSDFATWSDLQPIAPELTEGFRCIDLAIERGAGGWVAVWKEGGTARVAFADDLSGPWRFANTDGRPLLLRTDGSDVADTGMTHENAQLFHHAGRWHLLMTDYNPHQGWIYRMTAGDGSRPEHWLHWSEGWRICPPSEDFNTIPADLPCVRDQGFVRPLCPAPGREDRVQIIDGHCNAPFLFTDPDDPDWVYCLYAGKNQERRNDFNGRMAGGRPCTGWPRGWNRLALARSQDLQTWSVPPD